jgi:hypothetical protein
LDSVGYNLHNGPRLTLIDRFFVEGVLDPGLIQTFGILADQVDGEFSLFQRGDVPPDARVLSFFGVYSTIGISVELTMNNQRLGPDYTFSGLDITSFAGQTVDLKLTFKSNEFANDWSSLFITDGITMDGRIIPEPSSRSLFTFGALALRVFGAKRMHRKGTSTCAP